MFVFVSSFIPFVCLQYWVSNEDFYSAYKKWRHIRIVHFSNMTNLGFFGQMFLNLVPMKKEINLKTVDRKIPNYIIL